MPNKLSRFWQELKRRNVVRVITVYAGAAFVILELVDMIREPFELPNWSFKIVIVILSLGVIIAVILSWIYDIHPESGMVRTEPADKSKPEEATRSSNGWKIASYISFVVIVGLILLNIVPRSGKKEILEKSIAVLPFDNDSPASENANYINGYWTAVHSNLCKIKDLRVLTLQSTEQYRNQSKPISEIAKELDVGYLLSARGQIINERVRLTVYLTNASDDIVWSNPYDRQIKVVDDHINIMSEIAQLVARELQVVITPEEKQIIEKIPTADLTAYDFFQNGREEHWKYWNNNNDQYALERAENLYHLALSYDSSFGEAYTGLAWVFMDKYYWEDYFTDDFLDSVLIYTNMALSCDDQLPDAYTIRGVYYQETGENELALSEFDKALEYNPNNWEVYWRRGNLFLDYDLVESIKNYHHSVSLNRGDELPDLLRSLGFAYAFAGFRNKHRIYYEEAFKLDNDSVNFYTYLGQAAQDSGKYKEANNYFLVGYAMDTNRIDILRYIGWNYVLLGQYGTAFPYYERWMKNLKAQGNLSTNNMHRVGYVYWKNDFKQEAEYYFDLQVKYDNEIIGLGRQISENLIAYYDLAGVYAFTGEKDKAYENLKIFNQRKTIPLWALNLINSDPLFEFIRDESEFQQIIHDIEAKYQAEHERVRQWLEENDML